jgi:hypothetical protein
MAIFKKWMVTAIVLIGFLTTSCEKTEIYEVAPNTYTHDITVLKHHWRKDRDDSGPYFYYEYKEPKLTPDVFNYGIMQAFLVFNNGSISPLPFDDFWWIEKPGYDRTEQVTC